MHMDQQEEGILHDDILQLLSAGCIVDDAILQAQFQISQFDNNIPEMQPPTNYARPSPHPLGLPPQMLSPILLGPRGPGDDEWTLDNFLKTEALDMPCLDNTPPSHTITPCTERFEPVTPTQYPISLTAVPGAKLDTDRPPKRHRLQVPQITDGPDSHLVSLLGQSTFEYRKNS